jgi:hypothetical protein
MRDVIAKMLNSQEGIVLMIVMIMIGTNIALTGAKKILAWLKDKTESKADDKAYEIVSKVLSALDKVLEFASANSQALPPKAKAELEKKEWKEKSE